MCLLKCIKVLVCENPSAVNSLTSLINCCNLKKSTFICLCHHFEPSWVGRIYFDSDLKFWDCLLTGWLPTTSILIVIGTIITIIWRIKLFFSNCCSTFGIYIKFWIFRNKDEFCSFSIFAVIDSEKHAYLNA